MNCPGSGEQATYVHPSGGMHCPSCNGVYLTPDGLMPVHECERESTYEPVEDA